MGQLIRSLTQSCSTKQAPGPVHQVTRLAPLDHLRQELAISAAVLMPKTVMDTLILFLLYHPHHMLPLVHSKVPQTIISCIHQLLSHNPPLLTLPCTLMEFCQCPRHQLIPAPHPTHTPHLLFRQHQMPTSPQFMHGWGSLAITTIHSNVINLKVLISSLWMTSWRMLGSMYCPNLSQSM